MDLVNLTPHAVVLYERGACEEVGGKLVLKNKSARGFVSIPSSGLSRVRLGEEDHGAIKIGKRFVPLTKMEYGEPVGLPEKRENTMFIVSAITATAAAKSGRETDDLLIPAGVVRDERGIVIGCTKFAVL